MADMDDSNLTGSGGLPVHRSVHSRIQPWLDPNEALRPASDDEFLRELTGCLILVAPSGMSDDDRTEWLIAARATLQDIPADLLARGASVARKYCDHPSKIVATIIREAEGPWAARRRAHLPDAQPTYREAPRQIMEVITPAQIEEVKAEFGIVTQPFGHVAKPTGARPKMPTREDYIALGVSPEVLDRLPNQSQEKAA